MYQVKPPGWRRLREYQQTAALELAAWRRDNPSKVGLWMAAGVGKTSTVLAALHLLNPGYPWLFVTRALGRHVFSRDAAWLLGDDYVPGVLWSSKPRSKEGYHPKEGTYTSLELTLSERCAITTNYEILALRYQELKKVPWKAIVFDEAHALKGGYQKIQEKRDGSLHLSRYHYARDIARLVHARNGPVWELTATPIRDRRRDLWAQLDIALPGVFGEACNYGECLRRVPFDEARSFLRRYCAAHINQWGAVDSRGESSREMTEELERRLQKYFIKLTREDVAKELPQKQRDIKLVTPDKKSRKYMGGGVEEALARAAVAKLPVALDLMGDHLAGGAKVLIAVNRKKLGNEVTLKAARYIEKKLDRKTREEATVGSVNGDMPVRQRRAVLDKFNLTPGRGVMVATTDSLLESIDLHFVNIVIVLALPYSPGIIDQFEGRFARLEGVPCMIYYLVAEDTIDEKVRDILLDKLTGVVDVGVDTAEARSARDDLRDCYDEEEILEALKNWLAE
jgi:superfamily II DNA or RNA helicase